MFYVPGWKVKINGNLHVYITKCKLINDDYGESYYRTAIRNGDFIYPLNFGLVKKDKEYFIITFKNPTGIVKIAKSYFRPITLIRKKIKLNLIMKNYPETISELIFSIIIDYLNEKGYSSPIKTRGFLGRQSKGILSKRGEKIASVQDFENSKRDFYLCEAETFRVSYNGEKEEFNIVYNPRYEIFEQDFLLSQLKLKKHLLKYWKEKFLMNYEKIIIRYNKINDIFSKIVDKSKLFTEINKIETNDFKSGTIGTPNLISKSGNIIKLNSHKEFTKKITQYFENEIKLLVDKSVIGILVDIECEIPPSFVEILEGLGFKTKYYHFDLQNEFNKSLDEINTDMVFYLINDQLLNSNSKYHYFKEKTFELGIINKVIRISTLQNKNVIEVENAIKVSLLGLLYRKYNKTFWNLESETFDLIVSLTNTIRWSGYVNIISLTLNYSNIWINTGDIKLRQDSNYRDIFEELEKKISFSLKGKKILFISKYNTKNVHIEDIINWFTKKGATIIYTEISERDEGRIFYYSENNFLNPQPGSYLKISENIKYAEYLMITSETDLKGEFDNEKKLRANDLTAYHQQIHYICCK